MALITSGCVPFSRGPRAELLHEPVAPRTVGLEHGGRARVFFGESPAKQWRRRAVQPDQAGAIAQVADGGDGVNRVAGEADAQAETGGGQHGRPEDRR